MDIAVEQDGQVELFLDYGKGYEGMFWMDGNLAIHIPKSVQEHARSSIDR
jgi:hypothetical protein